MELVKAYKVNTRDVTGEFDDSEMMVFIPSGYKGVWLVVSEDPVYNISVRYATEEEVKFFKLPKDAR
jgi:hypothetical protein